MSLKDEINIDVKNFYDKIENQNTHDKLETLRNLLSKYAHLSTTEYMLNKKDLDMIISDAKRKFVDKTFPCFIESAGGRKAKVCQSDQANLCVVESTIALLNKKECLNRLPKFKYTTNKD